MAEPSKYFFGSPVFTPVQRKWLPKVSRIALTFSKARKGAHVSRYLVARKLDGTLRSALQLLGRGPSCDAHSASAHAGTGTASSPKPPIRPSDGMQTSLKIESIAKIPESITKKRHPVSLRRKLSRIVPIAQCSAVDPTAFMAVDFVRRSKSWGIKRAY
jgi:hypothetical protein